MSCACVIIFFAQIWILRDLCLLSLPLSLSDYLVYLDFLLNLRFSVSFYHTPYLFTLAFGSINYPFIQFRTYFLLWANETKKKQILVENFLGWIILIASCTPSSRSIVIVSSCVFFFVIVAADVVAFKNRWVCYKCGPGSGFSVELYFIQMKQEVKENNIKFKTSNSIKDSYFVLDFTLYANA